MSTIQRPEDVLSGPSLPDVIIRPPSAPSTPGPPRSAPPGMAPNVGGAGGYRPPRSPAPPTKPPVEDPEGEEGIPTVVVTAATLPLLGLVQGHWAFGYGSALPKPKRQPKRVPSRRTKPPARRTRPTRPTRRPGQPIRTPLPDGTQPLRTPLTAPIKRVASRAAVALAAGLARFLGPVALAFVPGKLGDGELPPGHPGYNPMAGFLGVSSERRNQSVGRSDPRGSSSAPGLGTVVIPSGRQRDSATQSVQSSARRTSPYAFTLPNFNPGATPSAIPGGSKAPASSPNVARSNAPQPSPRRVPEPNPLSGLNLTPSPVANPSVRPVPFPRLGPKPKPGSFLNPLGPQPLPIPKGSPSAATSSSPCNCSGSQPKKNSEKKKKKKRKGRKDCYRGTFIEYANRTRKYRKEKIKCQ